MFRFRTLCSIILLILITISLVIPLVTASTEPTDSFGETIQFIELPYPSPSSEWDDSWLKSDWTSPDTLRTNPFAFWSAALSGKVSRPSMDRRGLQERFIKGWLREGKRAAEVLRVFGTPTTILPPRWRSTLAILQLSGWIQNRHRLRQNYTGHRLQNRRLHRRPIPSNPRRSRPNSRGLWRHQSTFRD